MPNHNGNNAGHNNRKKHTSAFLRRLRRSIQLSASSMSSEQDRFRSAAPTVSVQKRKIKQVASKDNNNKDHHHHHHHQHQQGERIVRIMALPLHEDAAASPATTMVQTLPLTLGRRNLATWWWDACWDCHNNNNNNNDNNIDNRPRSSLSAAASANKKRRHFCAHRCRPLAKEVECLSKAMMIISKEGHLEFTGKNTGTLLHILHDKNKHNEKQQQQQRLFELSVGNEGEQPWMKFRIEIPLLGPHDLPKPRWLTVHNKGRKSVTPSPVTKPNADNAAMGNSHRKNVMQERPGSPLSVFSPEWCFPATEAARKLRRNKSPSPPRKRPKVLAFPSLQESQQQQKKKKQQSDDFIQGGDDKSLGKSPSTPRHRDRSPTKKKKMKRPSPFDSNGDDLDDAEQIQRRRKQKTAEFAIHRKENGSASSTFDSTKKEASLQSPPKRKLFNDNANDNGNDDGNDDDSDVSNTDIHHDKEIVAAKHIGMTQGFSALSNHSNMSEMDLHGGGNDDNVAFGNEGDHCHGGGQVDVFDADIGGNCSRESGTGAMTQGINTQICIDPLDRDKKWQKVQNNTEHSQSARLGVDTPEVQKKAQHVNAEFAISNSHHQNTQQGKQMDNKSPKQQMRLYCQQDSQTSTSSSITTGESSAVAPVESQQATSHFSENSAPGSELQPDSQPRFRLPPISFQRLNLSSEGGQHGGHNSAARNTFVSQLQSQQQELRSQGGSAAEEIETADNDSSSGLVVASQAQFPQCPRAPFSVGDGSGDDGVESQNLGKTQVEREMSQQAPSHKEKEEAIGIQSATNSQDSSVLDLPMCDIRFSTQSSLVVHDNMNHPGGSGCTQHQQDEVTLSTEKPRIQQLAHWKTLQQQKNGRSKVSRALIDLIVEKNQVDHNSNASGAFWLPSILDEC